MTLKWIAYCTYNACFIEENELVAIKDADFCFELLPEIFISLKSNSLYLQKQINAWEIRCV
jgi:hypothetical protein